MKNFRTKLTGLFTVTVAIFFLSSATAFAQKSNFSGTWKYNTEKSVASENGFRMSPTKITATQDELKLNSERIMIGRDGEDITTKDIISLDGKECENVAFQDIKKKSIATWSDDGKTLTIKSSMNFDNDGETMTFGWSETLTLGAEGKTLLLETTSVMGENEVKEKSVYDKVN